MNIECKLCIESLFYHAYLQVTNQIAEYQVYYYSYYYLLLIVYKSENGAKPPAEV